MVGPSDRARRPISIAQRKADPMALLQPAQDPVPTRESGQGLAEYALILALIAIVAIVALIFLGGQISSILSNVGKSM